MSNDGDEKKVTEELLSGFDRPGRTPRTPRARSRDFVDYYSGRDAAKADAAPPSKREETKSHEKPTVIVPRRNNVRATMTWVVAVVGMILFGATIAVLSTPQTPPSSSSAALPPMAPTSATTITSANPQPVDNAEPQAEPTGEPVVNAPTQPAQPKKAVPTTTITSTASSAPSIKTAPRDDFIRDL